jgi:hypothetical protein
MLLATSGRAMFAPVIGRIWPTKIGEPVAGFVVLDEPPVALEVLQAAARRPAAARAAINLNGLRDMSPPSRLLPQ